MGARKRWRLPAGHTPVALAVLVGIGLACTGIRQDEFLCENAVSHLLDCCQGFRASHLSCTYDDRGCGGTIYPELDVDQSNCILAESCAKLVSSGVCSRAIAAPSFNPDAYCPNAGVTAACSSPTVTVCQ